MTPMRKIYMLDINTKLDEDKIQEIYMQGYSRVPIFDGKRDNIVGILLVRDLLVINNRKQIVVLKQLGSLIIRDIIAVDVDSRIEPILKEFKKGTSHMCVVRKTIDDGKHDPYYQNLGIISLEDIIEEILQDDIEDEIDQEKQMVKKGEGLAKQQLIDLFSEKRANRVLSDHERNAICSYLSKYEAPFKRNKISTKALEQLVAKSLVVNIHSNERSLSEESEEENEENKHGIINIEKKEASETDHHTPNDIHIIKSEKYKSQIGKHNSFGIKPDDINLKFNPKFKSKTQIPEKEHSIPEASNEDPFDESIDSEAHEHNATKAALNKVAEDSDSEQSESAEESKSRTSSEESGQFDDEDINPILIVRNAPCDTYYLVLRGKVQITSGKEGFKVEVGSFSSIGIGSLLEVDYKPDFSAKVLGAAKLLKITRETYLEYLK